ncbi:MAG: AraC family transcriptional regulator [Tannerellaceae bacterium]|nr:AraC family transcriptional regulator [Tannerellaceae bacterium]
MGTILYKHQHVACFNYDHSDNPTFECLEASKENNWDKDLIDNKIIFILEGKFHLSYGHCKEEDVTDGKMVLIPGGCHCCIQAEEKGRFMICRLRGNIQFCDQFPFEKLCRDSSSTEPDTIHLTIHQRLQAYLKNLSDFIEDGMKCIYYYEIKLKELFFLLRAYYTREELRGFFQPLVSNDMQFSDFVLKNYHKVKNVKEFAELANYSISGFEKKFKKVFKVSAYKWMTEKKASHILHEIHTSHKPLKEIGWDNGFSSPAQFNDFCKIHFGITPGKLREKKEFVCKT